MYFQNFDKNHRNVLLGNARKKLIFFDDNEKMLNWVNIEYTKTWFVNQVSCHKISMGYKRLGSFDVAQLCHLIYVPPSCLAQH